MSRAGRRKSYKTGGSSPARKFFQRCAVRVTYTPNRMPGQWAAHGRYLTRESAAGVRSNVDNRFSSCPGLTDLAAVLGTWQKSDDPRVFKLILSPEFGDRMDLESFTQDLMRKMECDLGTKLEWVATAHYNTGYPHVHVALRGIDDQGNGLVLPRTYIQQGIRAHAERLATDQLGYRSKLDADEAQRREISQRRYTSLDRTLSRMRTRCSTSRNDGFFGVDLLPRQPVEQHRLQARLLFLHTMGIAELLNAQQWIVREDFETLLRGIQKSADRQRSLAEYSTVLSDPRLPQCVTDLRKIESLEGRVIGYAEDESSGRAYMILEATDHKVHFAYHTAEINAGRRAGKLRPNTFVQLNRQMINGVPGLEILDFGDAEKLLSSRHHMHAAANALQQHGATSLESAWAGWMGRYDAAAAKAVRELQSERKVDKAMSNAGPHR
jgi:hypothetical protein